MRANETMGERSEAEYEIRVERSVRTALDLLTKRRAFGVVAFECDAASAWDIVFSRKAETGFWCELLGKSGSMPAQPKRARFLYVGHPVHSRDDGDFYKSLKEEISDVVAPWAKLEACSAAALFQAFSCGELVVRVKAKSEEEANEIWLRKGLRLGADPGKVYIGNDFSSLEIALREVREEQGEPESDRPLFGAGASGDVQVDVADFQIMEDLSNDLHERARASRGFGYADDIFVQYSMHHEGAAAQYIAVEFFSNHRWNIDPSHLLNMRFTAKVLEGCCEPERARFSHPTKKTRAVGANAGRRFFVEYIVMSNRVEKRYIDWVADDHVLDSPVEVSRWLFEYAMDIGML